MKNIPAPIAVNANKINITPHAIAVVLVSSNFSSFVVNNEKSSLFINSFCSGVNSSYASRASFTNFSVPVEYLTLPIE